ncbi:hypothetical protein IMG5_173430, partial [Ichthyophthirius multifiliis]
FKKNEKRQLNNKNEKIQHYFTQEEVFAYSEHINHYLKDDEDLKSILPINPNSEELFEKVGNGILLCKLINITQPGALDVTKINTKNPNIFKINENLNMAISSAQKIGCVCINIHNQSIMEKSEHIILGLLWQIVKIQLLGITDVKKNPDIFKLKGENEDENTFSQLPKESLIIRWFNFHLSHVEPARKIANLEHDLQDGIQYMYLLNQLNRKKCPIVMLEEDQKNERLAKVIEYSKKLGVPNCIRYQDILHANQKSNLIFCAHLLNVCSGLNGEQEDGQDEELEDLVEFLNSFGVNQGLVNGVDEISEEIKNGKLLKKIQDLEEEKDNEQQQEGQNQQQELNEQKVGQNYQKNNEQQNIKEAIQLIKKQCLKRLKKYVNDPYLKKLKKEGESIEEFQKIPEEKLLLRWVNYHIQKSEKEKKITNFSTDFENGNVYLKLLDEITGRKGISGGENRIENQKEITQIIHEYFPVLKSVICPIQISKNEDLNTIFCAQLYEASQGNLWQEELDVF